MSNIIQLGPHAQMTPEEALAFVQREDWENVIIIGYHTDSNAVFTRSSQMSRETALWIIEQAKMHILDIL